MGQPVTVIEKPSTTPRVVRFEINRSITGMGIERYPSPESVIESRPPDVAAKALFEHGGVQSITINSNMITVELQPGATTAGMKELIEELFLYYREGVEVVMPEGVSSD
jgi:Scaffold protein Nfu/NifU N terminal